MEFYFPHCALVDRSAWKVNSPMFELQGCGDWVALNIKVGCPWLTGQKARPWVRASHRSSPFFLFLLASTESLVRRVHIFGKTRNHPFAVLGYLVYLTFVDVCRVGAIAAVDVIRPTRAELVHPIDGVIASLTIEAVRVRMLATQYFVWALHHALRRYHGRRRGGLRLPYQRCSLCP
jgi:hypothetical protein